MIGPGICQCGCDRPTRIATKTDRSVGQTRGVPLRFIKGHNRAAKIPGPRYHLEDRGYKTPCHIWEGALDGHGYGQRRHNGKLASAHRVAYEEEFGPIPEGLHLDHLCRVVQCIRADHGEPVPQIVNTRRGAHIKLSAEKVREIRLLRSRGMKYRELAEQFSVSMSLVNGVIHSRVWADIT